MPSVGDDDVGRRCDGVGRVGRRTGSLVRDGHDVDPVPSSADPVAGEREAELALDVRRDDGVRLELGLPEPPQGEAAPTPGAPPRARG